MLQIDRNTLGMNELIYLQEKTETHKGIERKVTLLGRGIIDKIALGILRLLGICFKNLKPVRIKLRYSQNQALRFPKEMYVTRRSLKALLSSGAEHANLVTNNQFSAPTQARVLDKMMSEIGSKVYLEDAFGMTKYYLQDQLNQQLYHLEQTLIESLQEIKEFPHEMYFLKDAKSGRVFLSGDESKIGAESYIGRIKFTADAEPMLTVQKGADIEPEDKFVLTTMSKAFTKIYKSSETVINRPQVLADLVEREIKEQQFFSLKNLPIHPAELEKTRLSVNVEDETVIYDANAISLNGKCYIATHEPMPNEQLIFWEMMHQQPSTLIVKLSQTLKNPHPSDKNPDFSYWPSLDEKQWGAEEQGFSIKIEEEEQIAEFLIKRTFTLTKDGEEKKITQLDFLAWPDCDIPKAEHLEVLLETLKSEEKHHSKGPMTVHCEGGVGRTGTFLALHSTLSDSKPDHLKLVGQLRRQRSPKMIETPEQFLFLETMHKKLSAQK